MSLTERGNCLERARGNKGNDFNFVHIEFFVPWNFKVKKLKEISDTRGKIMSPCVGNVRAKKPKRDSQ